MPASITLPAAHKHTLFFLETTKLFATKGFAFWRCDACKRTSKEMQWTYSYRCMDCDFDICEECSKPIKTTTHPHRLVVTDAKTVYENGKWGCDNCSSDYSSQGYLPRHCEEGCIFDICFGCTRSHKSLAHHHRLWKANSKLLYPQVNGWKCDRCQAIFVHDAQEKPYHCTKCTFDLCFKCLKETIDVQPKTKPSRRPATVTDGRVSKHLSDGSTTEEEQAAQVFLSYNWNIQDKVLALKRKLESMNIKCWMDTGNMVAGDDLKKEIDKGMRGAKIVISCVTKAYSQSNACQQEVALADVLKKPILPVLFESLAWPPEGPMAMPFAPLIYVSLKDGLTGENLDKVVKTIQSRTGMRG